MHKIQFLHEGGQCGSEQGEKEDAISTSPPHAKKTKTGTEKEENRKRLWVRKIFQQTKGKETVTIS